MNDLIRSAIAAEAEERVDSRIVLAELHKAKKRRKPLGLIIGVASLTAAAAAAAVIIPTAVKKTDAAPATLPPAQAENVLLIGTDDVNNTDALVFARFEPDGTASVISLPRDIYVGSSRDKINSLYLGGPRRLTEEIQHLTGAKVDHFAAIKMSEFGRIATAVGGVEVCLNAAVKERYSGVDLPAGRQTISGDQALGFLRQRMGLPNGDLDRTKRHQAFLSGLAAKITKDNAAALARAVSGSIQVDEGWDVLAFAARFQGPVKIRTATLPVGETIKRDGVFGFAPDPAQAKQFVEDQFGGKGTEQNGCVN
ncbi:LCP family protein [Lentzea nigeriaca]|uniref:LCP family protein n=1 Tax=Lentzea nigeriaca TaxID=1128665 RepID=UPI0019587F98|nr:LCP family protein [Lentzea nigeriaca]MBM7859210.1 LCP family protein required for cell wall assembly [Lentzea nigeriaca]